jgi:Glycosyl hydrolase catalytic core
MLRRLAKSLPLLACLCALAAAAFPTAAGAVMVGVSDNGFTMFWTHRFQRLNIRTARYMTYWNVAVMRDKRPLHDARVWIKTAEQAGVTPMVSFSGNGNYIPSWQVYASAIKAFLHDFPEVKTYTPWNEPDWIYRPALANNPKLAADYFNVLIHWCHGCTIAAGDVYLPANQLGPWIASYRRYLHARPRAWALHNYYDVRSHTTSQVQTLARLTSGQIWLTETAGILRRGHWPYPNQSAAAAGRDEAFLFSIPRRFPRVTRIYHYEWQGTYLSAGAGWDSGLIGANGVPRPSFTALSRAAGLRHPRKQKR